MVEFFGCVASALAGAEAEAKYPGEMFDGAGKVHDFAATIVESVGRAFPGRERSTVVREALGRAASTPLPEFELQIRDAVNAVIAEEPAELRERIAGYVGLMPARIRQTFARRDDPAGETVPANWNLSRPEDLLPLLPPRPPMFREGESPPGATKWVLAERLGVNGFGEVWKARHTQLKDRFAVFKFCLDPASRRRILEREAEVINQVMNQIDHPNVAKLQEVDFNDRAPWLQYDYVPGGDLGRLAATWPTELPARARFAVDAIKTLASAVAYCHQLQPPVVHRDLKPGNVLIARDGKLKITDFGISDVIARQALNEARIAAFNELTCPIPSLVRWANAPLYASRQQKDGLDPHPSDDVHALGVMLYQLLLADANLRPGTDFRDDLAEHRFCEELITLLSRSVSERAPRRYQNAGELAEALERLPKELTGPTAVVSTIDSDKRLYEEIDRRVEDARRKNETARRQFDRREWVAAVATLESIFHPVMRDKDLYAQALAYRDGSRFVNALGMEFALVPKGNFWVGGQDGNHGDAQAAIEQDFYLGVCPVTQEEWQKVMGGNPSYFQRGGKGADKLAGIPDADLQRFPVELVSWNDCQQFVQKLNEHFRETGWVYRLPYEAEWEYACRGGATSPTDCGWNFYFQSPTNTLSAPFANFAKSALQRTTKVGSYPANPLGIYDLHGNVWEWCEDTSENSYRAIRGGGWYSSAEYCRVAYRYKVTPTSTGNSLGLRLARVPVRA